MSLYERHAKGDIKRGKFKLTMDNIDTYHNHAVDVADTRKWIHNLASLLAKQACYERGEAIDDELYTEEYVRARLAKLKKKREWDDMYERLLHIDQELTKTNEEIGVVFPLVMDKVEGLKQENRDRMNELHDRRIELEDEMESIYAQKYADFKEGLPKIYYMLVDGGGDINTVTSCFRQMKDVLLNKVSSGQAVEQLKKESTEKYKLPSGVWETLKTTK